MKQTVLAALWRRRLIVLATVAIAVAGAVTVSALVERRYETSAKLLVVHTDTPESLGAIQAALVTARTYSDILESPNIARRVAARLGGGMTPAAAAEGVDIRAVPDTQLLEIRAHAPDPDAARVLADTYVAVFIDHARRRLSDATGATVSLADPAPPVSSPSRPRPALNVAIACLLAIPLGIWLGLLRDRLDSRLRSPEELEVRFSLRTLARVPPLERSERSRRAFDEAFRVLRTMIGFAGAESPVGTLAVTSSSASEGKTTTAVGLARTAIEAGQRVLLVEADPYRPRLQAAAAEDAGDRPGTGEPGLTDYLAGTASLDDVLRGTSQPLLRIIPAGGVPASMSALLETDRGRELILDLAPLADLVVLDCPPVGPRADATVLAARAHATVLVVDLRIATEHTVRRALQRLRAGKARLLGVVVNRDPATRAPRDDEDFDGERGAARVKAIGTEAPSR